MKGAQRRKVSASHLAREACLYVRQATLREGIEGAASLQPQYDLRQQASALGWPAERVTVIDSDVNQSGVSRTRPGFQKLVRRIKRGRVGIVMALEAPRLTRNFRDWQRLLDACARNHTLVLQQGLLLDPADSHDRVLLGGKETMSRPPKSSRQEREALV